MEIENVTSGSTLAMSTKEIAELTGKRHGDVIRDVKVMIAGIYGEFQDADLRLKKIQGVTWTFLLNGFVAGFDLDKSHTMTLVAGYDVRVRKRIVDRWLELEGMSAPRESAPLMNVLQSLASTAERLATRLEIVESRLDSADAKQAEERERSRVAERFQQDPRRVGVEYISAYDVLKSVPRKGRGAFVPKVRGALLEFAQQHHEHVAEEAPRSNGFKERLFTRAMVQAWLADEGHAMIAAHLAKQPYARVRSGQGVLKFVRPTSPT